LILNIKRRKNLVKFGKIYLKEKRLMIRFYLSDLLGARKWTQRDLSRATGIRPNTINDLYHEMSERISFKDLDLICEALDCEVSDIIARKPNKIPLTNQEVLAKLHNKR